FSSIAWTPLRVSSHNGLGLVADLATIMSPLVCERLLIPVPTMVLKPRLCQEQMLACNHSRNRTPIRLAAVVSSANMARDPRQTSRKRQSHPPSLSDYAKWFASRRGKARAKKLTVAERR